MRSSLSRVLEPEVMDSPGDAADYDAMDHAEVNRVFVEDFLAALAVNNVARGDVAAGKAAGDKTGANAPPRMLEPSPAAVGLSFVQCLTGVLDVGTGTAQIPIALCRRSAHARVLAVDLAESMLALARRNVEQAGLAERIRLERVDAKQLPYPTGSFAAVMSNSIVHHIPEPAAVLGEMLRATAPGGLLFVRDLARPADAAELERLVACYAAGANPHQRQLFADSLRAALSLAEVQAIVAGWNLPVDDVAMTSDRHWTWSARRPA